MQRCFVNITLFFMNIRLIFMNLSFIFMNIKMILFPYIHGYKAYVHECNFRECNNNDGHEIL